MEYLPTTYLPPTYLPPIYHLPTYHLHPTSLPPLSYSNEMNQCILFISLSNFSFINGRPDHVEKRHLIQLCQTTAFILKFIIAHTEWW